MQKKQVKQAAKPKAGAKPAKSAAKPAAKGAAKGAATKGAATKGTAKSGAKPATKAPAKAATKATKSTKAASPVRKAAAAPAPRAAAPARDDSGATSRSTSRSVVKPVSRHRHDDTSMIPVPVPKVTASAPIIPQRKFTFEDAGRTFNCRVEPLRPSGSDAWWWFDVSVEQHQRHAPFRAEAGDTLDEVRARVVKYYDELLARRAEPAPSRWNRRPSTPGTPAIVAPVEGADDEDAPLDVEGVDVEGVDVEGDEVGVDEPEMVGLEEAEGIAEDATA